MGGQRTTQVLHLRDIQPQVHRAKAILQRLLAGEPRLELHHKDDGVLAPSIAAKEPNFDQRQIQLALPLVVGIRAPEP